MQDKTTIQCGCPKCDCTRGNSAGSFSKYCHECRNNRHIVMREVDGPTFVSR